MLLLTCCSICDKVHADNGRKKVAVVLSGGGAKGMAHIGVLKVIQKWLSVHFQSIYERPAHVFGFVPGVSHISRRIAVTT